MSTQTTSRGLILARRFVTALLSQQEFTPGRPDGKRQTTLLGEELTRWLEQNAQVLLFGGDPTDPIPCAGIGFSDQPIDPIDYFEQDQRTESRVHLAGFWRDRRLVLICLRKGLTAAECEHLFHLLTHYAGKGLQFRTRLYEEQSRGHLSHVSMVFLDDLPSVESPISWPARVALGWLHRDLNILSRAMSLATKEQLDWRESLIEMVIELPHKFEVLIDFFVHFDLISEKVDNYDKDELVFYLLEKLDDSVAVGLSLQLCEVLEKLTAGEEEQDNKKEKEYQSVKWITRRLADHLLEKDIAGPEHLHALVWNKVLLYEEIPRRLRPRVASLQVLTSFLANPQKYFTDIENSHSPEVLETKLWRLLEMVPKLVHALRFDVANQVLGFSQRFGPTFDMQNKPELMEQLMEISAGVLLEASRHQQADFMNQLPEMGKTGTRLLIDLSDHPNRSVRRIAIDALLKVGPPVIPVLFDIQQQKHGWHYLRNMLLLLTQLNAGGPKVEKLLRQSLKHAEPNVRKEALLGLSKLLRADAAVAAAEALDDDNSEVRKCAAACLGLTGVHDPVVYRRLAEMLSKNCPEELAIQIAASICRIKPGHSVSSNLESALLGLLDAGGLFSFGNRKGAHSDTLKIAVVKALAYIGREKTVKVLGKLSNQKPELANAVRTTLKRINEEKCSE